MAIVAFCSNGRKLLPVEPEMDRECAGESDHDPEMNPPERPAGRGPVFFQGESDGDFTEQKKKCSRRCQNSKRILSGLRLHRHARMHER